MEGALSEELAERERRIKALEREGQVLRTAMETLAHRSSQSPVRGGGGQAPHANPTDLTTGPAVTPARAAAAAAAGSTGRWAWAGPDGAAASQPLVNASCNRPPVPLAPFLPNPTAFAPYVDQVSLPPFP